MIGLVRKKLASVTQEHTVKAFGEELDNLAAVIGRMGGLVEAQIADAVDVVARRKVTAVDEVIERDRKLDALDAEVEQRAVRLFALRAPMAQDLRQTMAAMKISGNLERCGDLAKNIAKRGGVLAQLDSPATLTRPIERMGNLVAARIKDVLDAYASGDVERARAVWTRDDEIDGYYDSIFRELLTYMMSDPRTITSGAHLLFVAKNLERIGDHATNIAEIVHYQLTGESIGGARPKLDSLATAVEAPK